MTTGTLNELRSALRSQAEPGIRAQHMRVLRPADGDELLGVRVPVMRDLARRYPKLPPADVDVLLHSRVHEERFVGLLVLAEQARRARGADLKALVDFYLARTDCVDNWDLVDCSAHLVLGPWLLDGAPLAVLDELAASPRLWDRRIAVLATLALIRAGRFEPTLHLALTLRRDPEPLIHKAVGWMLREIGRRDRQMMLTFLDQHLPDLPRLTVRYATEHLPPDQRARYVKRR
ncbi:DNA alkylation repair protein [Streptomyces resistomycificus]|uniref:DNA alkylation repair protein n=1 Tax=Streptomyces resistomycificus TaxID=67356 RepID=A0A0L8LJF9_9ACTN|nr:DNA alkylation repair protein [Streptomyces resistomycificus]KOG38206.1 DNA alkylation repair protein [Streptomyces resistomycificus]KUN98777.1 DNA alkylation repair protein [Streptomyces resistomycificus]